MGLDIKGLDIKKMLAPFLGAKDLVGVDIGSHSVKLVYLKGSPGKYSLSKWGIAPLAVSANAEASAEDRKTDVIKALKKLISEQGLSGKRAALSVAGNSVIVRYVKFLKMSPEDLKKSIQFEAEPYIPFDIRDVNIGFSILGDIVEEGQKKMETVLVAAKKDVIQFKVDCIREAGLKPVIVDVDAFALESAYENSFDANMKETVMIINIGMNVTNIAIIENGISKVVRDVFVSGGSISKVLQKNLQCTQPESEDIKMKFGVLATVEDKDKALAEDNKEAIQISNIIYPVLKDLLSEVQRSLDFYLSQGPERTITRVLISGGTAQLKNIDRFFTHELKLPVEIFNPFLKIKGSDKIPVTIAGSLTIAAGLASRKVGDCVA